VGLAFVFGYLFTMVPLLRAGLALRAALGLALAADTASVAIMEVVDNAVMLAIPGAMHAPAEQRPLLGKPRPGARHRGGGGLPRQSLAHRPRARARRRPRASRSALTTVGAGAPFRS
jgi:hypothetical protein